MVAQRTESERAKPRRRRSGETDAAFPAAARKLVRRRARLPPEACAAAAFLADTLDWLTLWHGNGAADGGDYATESDAQRNHLTPGL